MPAVKKTGRSCPFCQAQMAALPDRVLLGTTSRAGWDARKPLTPATIGADSGQPRLLATAHVCVGCGFVALFEV